MAYSKEDLYDAGITEQIASHYREILRLLGEDPEREGLVKTPERVAKALQFLTQGYCQDGAEIIRGAIFKEEYRQMVLVRDIELYSTCEHHVMPFIGKAHVAYIPDGYITGLSKIARVVETYARRLQVQERLTVQSRDCIQQTLHPLGVAVVIEAAHTCMQIRGVQKANAVTTTSAFSGVFLKDERTRNEFLKSEKFLKEIRQIDPPVPPCMSAFRLMIFIRIAMTVQILAQPDILVIQEIIFSDSYIIKLHSIGKLACDLPVEIRIHSISSPFARHCRRK